MILTEIDVGGGPGHKTGQEAQSRQSSTWRRFLAKFSHVLLQMWSHIVPLNYCVECRALSSVQLLSHTLKSEKEVEKKKEKW